MIVISDTTPINYLVLIGEIELLPKLYGQIVIPQAVLAELLHDRTPQEVKDWIGKRPEWLEVRLADPSLLKSRKALGPGEQEAIALALEIQADAVLMDDRAGVKEARRQGLLVLTTLLVFDQAASEGLIDLQAALDKLSQTSFRFPPEEIINDLFANDRQRKRAKHQDRSEEEQNGENV